MGTRNINGEDVTLSRDEELAILRKSPVIHIYKDRLFACMEYLDNEQSGILFKMIIQYSQDWESPECDDKLVMMAFSNLKCGMDQDAEKYITTALKNRKNGQNGGRPRKTEEQKTQNNPVGFAKTQDNPEKPYTDTNTKTDTDTNTKTSTETERGTGETTTCNDTETETSTCGTAAIEVFDEAYIVLNEKFKKYKVSPEEKAMLLMSLQNSYEHCEYFSEEEIDEMAKHSKEVCNTIKQSRGAVS